jgi:ubiquinone/menaquinone biosynthesis C-methylase UbiE
MSDFDRIARAYRWLEYLAFGGSLQRARLAHLPALRQCRRILVVGDGDGRCMAALVAQAPDATIHCIDTSQVMLRLARNRVPAHARARVSFEHTDVRTLTPAPDTWDGVLTMFVLDCMSPADVRLVVTRLFSGLTPGGQWLFADFVLPQRGWRRVRARMWMGLLYAFFRSRTDLDVSSLPPSEDILRAAGLAAVDVVELQQGMIRAGRFERPNVVGAVGAAGAAGAQGGSLEPG